jgi:hypothetical protein
MGKRSKNNMVNSTPPRSKKKFLLEVVLQLEKLESAKLVSEYLGISKQRLNYYLNKLKRLEIVEKRGYGVWAVNRNNFYLLDQALENTEVRSKKEVKKTAPTRLGEHPPKIFTSRSVAGHAYLFVAKVPFFDFDRVKSYLDGRVDFKVIPQGLSFSTDLFDGWRVWLCRESVVLYAPKGSRYFAVDEFLAFRRAFSDCLVVLRKLDGLLPFSLSKDGRFFVKPRREHNAHLDKILPSVLVGRRKSFAVWDDSGVWLRVDASLGVPELETEASGCEERVSHIRDASRLVREDFNCLKDKGITREFLLEQDARISAKLEFYADHIKSHAEVMQRIGNLLNKLENNK